MVVQAVGKKRLPSDFDITTSQQDDVGVIKECQVSFGERRKDHSAVDDAESFHGRHEDRIEVRIITVRCANISSLQSIARPDSLNQESSIFTPKKKLAISE
jgi:hypothetical protein